MKIFTVLTTITVSMLFLSAQSAAQDNDDKVRATTMEFSRTSRILVHYRGEGDIDVARRRATENGLKVVEVNEVGQFLVCERTAAVAMNALAFIAAVQRIAASPAVEVVEPDFVIEVPKPFEAAEGAGASAIQAFTTTTASVAATGRPNDPRLQELWGIANSGALNAWTCGHSTSSTVVAVIDTGVDYTHPELVSNMWINRGETPSNGVDDDKNGFVDDVFGYDFANDDGDPADDHLHGTHCAGTVGAVGDNGRGVVGVSWSVRIMALKFLRADGNGNVSDAVKCIDYARQNGAKVINNSYRFLSTESGSSVALRQAIERARDAGIVFVVAAGNDFRLDNDGSFKAYPASYTTENIISVAAIDEAESLANFSNIGVTSVDLAAPGVNILSTAPGDQYTFLDGTSMASPHVAGAAALILGHPGFSGASSAQIKSAILDNARPLASLKGFVVTGGTLDLRFLCEADTEEAPAPGSVYVGANATASGIFVLDGKSGRASYQYNGMLIVGELAFVGEGTSPEGLQGWIYRESNRPEPRQFLFTKNAVPNVRFYRVYAREAGNETTFWWLMDAAVFGRESLPKPMASLRREIKSRERPQDAPALDSLPGKPYLVGYRESQADRVAKLCQEHGLEVVERYAPGRFIRVRTTPGTSPDFKKELSAREAVRFVDEDRKISLP